MGLVSGFCKYYIIKFRKPVLLLKYDKPMCQGYHEKKFDHHIFNWKLIYRAPHIATFETKIRIFQYKLLNNALYLSKKLFHFGIISQSKCSFFELYDEIPQHIFYECTYAQNVIYGTNFDYIFQKKLHYQI